MRRLDDTLTNNEVGYIVVTTWLVLTSAVLAVLVLIEIGRLI